MIRETAVVTVLLFSLAGDTATERIESPADRAYSAFSSDPSRRFDFWVGEWDVDLRMLQDDLTWKDSIVARDSVYAILGGKAILELWDSKPIKGFSLRYFDAANGLDLRPNVHPLTH